MVVDGIDDDYTAATDSDFIDRGSDCLHEKPPSVASALRGLSDGEASKEIPGDHIGTSSGDGAR